MHSQGLGISAAASGSKPEAPDRLKINLMKEPLGVPKENLSFSWAFEDQDKNETQSAYQLVISETTEDFQQGVYLFDSGWTKNANSAGVMPEGISGKLQDNRLNYWAVQDSESLESPLSQPQAFVTEVGDEWAGKNGVWGDADQKFVFFRSVFSLLKPVEKVVANVTAGSTEPSRQFVYQFYLNGALVGLGPAEKNGASQYYNTYDLTPL